MKITDYGLAGALDQREAPEPSEGLGAIAPRNWEGSTLTVVRVGKGQVAGTLGYMAPEVLRGEGADVRSDVYSFGVVLYQMVTGNPGVHLVNRYELAPLARVDSILWPVIERCLVAQARSRYPSFTLVRRELEGLVKKSGGVVIALPEINELTAWEWNGKGFSLANLGRHDEAMACYDRALEIDPRDALAWNNKGTGLLELGRREEAHPLLRPGAGDRPQTGDCVEQQRGCVGFPGAQGRGHCFF